MDNLIDINDIVSLIDEDTCNNDDLDLLKLVSTNANDSNQYLLFLGSDNQYYAKNVSKIEELLVYKDLDIVRNNDDGFILGTANIRGQMTSIVNFDNWMGNKVLDDNEYELVIIVSYGGKRFALVVKEVEYIVTIESSNMNENSMDNSKSLFISEVAVKGENKLCTIFDSDMLLMNVFSTIEKQSVIDTASFKSSKKTDKVILFADDSKFIRRMVEKLFIQLEHKYIIYNDGQELMDDLANVKIDDIGLIITDLEMPVASGRDVIEYLRKDIKYNDINIIIHTNMSNEIIEDEYKKFNIAKTIGKVDMLTLGNAINKFIA